MECDVAVIGSGPGGYVAAIRASQLGFKVVCIDKRATFGGTCLNVGCIPSKALLNDTDLYHSVLKDGVHHGLEFKSLEPNFLTMMQRKEAVVKANTDGVDFLFKKNKVTGLHGEAKLLDANRIQVGQETIQAKNIILATGSEPIALPFLPIDETRIVSSTGALSLKKVPKKMAIIGAGVIGVEIASIYSRLGAEVTLIEMLNQICTGLDDAVIKALFQILQAQGLVIHLSSQVKSAEIKKEKITLQVAKGEESFNVEADVVLVAVGRKAVSEGFGLKELGIEVNLKGQVVVNAAFQTSLPTVYAIGDLIDGPMLAHKASEEGVAVAEIIAGLRPHVNYLAVPNIIYTDPEVAALGLTEKEAREAHLEIFTGMCPFRANPRARCMGRTEGFVKVIGEVHTGRLIGLHIIGPSASELISEGVLAIEKRATVTEMAQAPNGHPTLSEAIKEACLAALKRPINI